MNLVLTLLCVQGVLGAADTLYYHEWRARLPGGVPGTAPELRLHGARDWIYAILFGTLPFVAWQGALAGALGMLIFAEILITLADFVTEDRVRKPMGGVYPGERVMHTIMAILYGAVLAELAPLLLSWSHAPTGWVAIETDPIFRWIMPVMAVGVFVSGARDLAAAAGVRAAAWPW